MIRLWLLIHLLIFLLPAVGTSLVLPAVGFALVLPAVGFALVLPAVAPVLPAVPIISHLLTRIRFSEYRHPSSAFLQLRVAFGNVALPVFFFWSPLALLVVVLSLFFV